MAVRPWIRRVLHPIVAYFAILGRASSCGLSQHLHTGALLGHSDYRLRTIPYKFHSERSRGTCCVSALVRSPSRCHPEEAGSFARKGPFQRILASIANEHSITYERISPLKFPEKATVVAARTTMRRTLCPRSARRPPSASDCRLWSPGAPRMFACHKLSLTPPISSAMIISAWIESWKFMAKHKPKSQPTWTDVKAKLADFDRARLLCLIQSLYAAHKDNQTFLHARFGLGEDVLEPYKKTIDRWLWPDLFRKQDTPVSQAKRAISDYKKAVGDPEGLAELMVFYCERAAGFCSDVGNDDEGYFDALVRMFEQALKSANALPAHRRDDFITRLDRVRAISHEFGYGVGDDMDFLLSKFTLRSL